MIDLSHHRTDDVSTEAPQVELRREKGPLRSEDLGQSENRGKSEVPCESERVLRSEVVEDSEALQDRRECTSLIVGLSGNCFVIVRPDESQKDLWPVAGGWTAVRNLRAGDRVVYRGTERTVRAVTVYGVADSDRP